MCAGSSSPAASEYHRSSGSNEQKPEEEEEEEETICPVCEGSGFFYRSDPCPLCCEDDGHGEDAVLAVGASSWTLTPLTPRSPLCLVLDIDGTLLSECANVDSSCMARYLRPHLQEFLDFAFASFSAVGIWTAASQQWLDAFLEAVDPGRLRQWTFTWSFSKITWMKLQSAYSDSSDEGHEPVMQHVKRLSKIYQQSSLRKQGFSAHTTLLVDNNPSVCLPNYGNSIYIKTYNAEEDPRGDDWLLVLSEYLRSLDARRCPGVTLRHIDKRGWYEDTKEETLRRRRAHTL